jgi:hypothetical protein
MNDQPSFACVVGAPRCGTTSLARFIEDHPQVCFSRVKEPHFFVQHDLSQMIGTELNRFVESEYFDRYFPPRPKPCRLIAEGSVSYLYAPHRMETVLRLWPDARFVIALRDPMEMLPSLHRRLLFNGDETVSDFATAWALTGERKQGRSIPPTCIDSRALHYDVLARLGTHVGRFFRMVGSERCFVVLLEELITDPEDVYRRLMSFLGLPVGRLPDFSPRRQAQGFRIGWLQRLLKRPPVVARGVLAGEKFRMRIRPMDRDDADSVLLRSVFAARKRLIDWNAVPLPPVQLADDVRRDIRERLAGEVALLSELIGRDLGHWLDNAGAGRLAPSAPAPVAHEAAAA